MKAKIDQTDCKIIELLQKDGRMPNTMARVSMSPSLKIILELS
jgi:DNA-binding Lrp family transcriptional regulator